MFFFLQSKRLTAAEALQHPYLTDARVRYHSCMCSCCYRTQSGSLICAASDLEPVCTEPLGPKFDEDLNSIHSVRGNSCWSCITFVVVLNQNSFVLLLLNRSNGEAGDVYNMT
jgi:hypothetical protein